MTTSTPDSTLPDWRVTLAFGLLLIVLGTVGLYLSVFVTLASVLLFGGFLIAGGVLHGIEVFRKQDRRKGTRLENLLIALIYIGMGLLIAYDPVAASAGLTLMIAGLFAAMGAIRLTHAWQRRNAPLADLGALGHRAARLRGDDHERLAAGVRRLRHS